MGFDYQSLASGQFQMPDGWKRTTIEEVAKVNEKAITPKNAPSHIRYIDIASVDKGKLIDIQKLSFKKAPSRARRVIRDKDSLISTVRPNLEHYLFVKESEPNTIASTGFAVVSAKAVDPRFLYYYMTSKPFTAYLTQIAESHTSAYPAFNPDVIKNAELILPPDIEQRAIAHILGSLDDKIELNRRMNQTLEEMARSIFKSWFVDFDPVRAKACRGESRFALNLPPEILDLFPDSFEDSELGEIPKGWEVTQLSNKIGFQGGFAFKSKDWQDVGVPVVKIGSVKPGVIDLKQVSYVSNAIAEEARRFRLNVADLLIGMTGYVGEVGIVPPTDLLPLLNQRVGKFVLPYEGTKSLGFWYCTTRRSEFKRYVESVAHGTAQANVSGSGIMSYKLIVPNAELIGYFNGLSQPFFDKILENYKEIENLASLRDTLLPKLISGELRVPDAEKFIEEAGV
jgi:type I restriction enzyme S subunit